MEGYNETLRFIIEKHPQLVSNILKSKLFILNNKNIHNCLLKTTNKIGFRKLPFNSLFIETLHLLDTTKGKSLMNGIYLQYDEEPNSFCISFLLEEERDNENMIPTKFISFSILKNGVNYIELEKACIKCNIDYKNFKQIGEGIAEYVCNFLDFLNNPDVEIISIERTKEANIKRIKKGKLPIPITNHIRVAGKLKIYLDKLNLNGSFSYSHKFWVRGHFRTLRNEERYKGNIGTKIWILPYVKGEGILINKQYEVSKE